VDTVRFQKAVYVVHAFPKKSPSGRSFATSCPERRPGGSSIHAEKMAGDAPALDSI
jgi:hypothetical protein